MTQTGIQQAFDEFFDINDKPKFLILQQGAAMGKSTTTVEKTVEHITKHPDKHVVIVTSTKKLRDDMARRFEKLIPNKYINVLSQHDEIVMWLHDEVIKHKAKKTKITFSTHKALPFITNNKRSLKPVTLDKIKANILAEIDTELNNNLPDQPVDYNTFKVALNNLIDSYFKIRNQDINEDYADIDNQFRNETNKFRLALRNFIYKNYKKYSGRKHSTLQMRVKWINEYMPFVCDMYPTTNLDAYNVAIVQIHKLYHGQSNIVGGPHDFIQAMGGDSEHKDKVSLIIDESDEVYKILTKLIIQDASKADNMLRLFNALSDGIQNFTVDGRMSTVKDKNGHNIEFYVDAIKKIINDYQTTYPDVSLRDTIEISDKIINDSTTNIKMFNSSADMSISDHSKYRIAPSDYDHVLEIHDSQDDTDYLNNIINYLDNAIRRIFMQIYHIATISLHINPYNESNGYDEDLRKREKAVYAHITDYLSDENFSHELNQLLDAYLPTTINRYSIVDKTSTLLEDPSFYTNGFQYTSVYDDEDVFHTVKSIKAYYLDNTAENVLGIFASEANILLMSATANNNSSMFNFNLDYLHEHLSDDTIFEFSKKVETALTNDSDKRSNDFDPVNLQVDILSLKDYAINKAGKPVPPVEFATNYFNISETEAFALWEHLIAKNLVDPRLRMYLDSSKWGEALLNNQTELQLPKDEPISIYQILNLFKLVKAYLSFKSQYDKNHTQCAYLIIATRSLTNEVDSIVDIASFITKQDVDPEVFAVATAENMDTVINHVHQDWAQQTFKILALNSTSGGRGVNLQYKIPQVDDNYIQTHPMFGKEPETDISGLYLDAPTHLFSSISDNQPTYETILTSLLQQFELDYNQEFSDKSIAQSNVNSILSGNGQFVNYWDSHSAKVALAVQFEQILGRLDRAPYKTKDMQVIVDGLAADRLGDDGLDYLSPYFATPTRTNPITRRVVSTIENKNPGLVIKHTPEEQIAMTNTNHYRNYMYKHVLAIIKQVRNGQQYISDTYTSFRAALAKYLIVDDLSIVANVIQGNNQFADSLRNHLDYFYIKLPQGNSYSYSILADTVHHINFDTTDPNFDLQTLTSPVQNVLNDPTYFKESNKLFGQTYTNFTGKYIINPFAYNDFVKGVIGEVVGGDVLNNELNGKFHDMNELAIQHPELFELSDAYLETKSGQIILVDFKNYNIRSDHYDRVLQKTLRRHLTKAKESNPNVLGILCINTFLPDDAKSSNGNAIITNFDKGVSYNNAIISINNLVKDGQPNRDIVDAIKAIVDSH